MNVIKNAIELPGQPRKVCVAIGVFDGVHLGHQQVIRQTTSDASHHEAHSIAVTFDKHPNAIVAPHAVPNSIYSLDQKLESIAALGVDTTLMIDFDKEFSQLTAEAFIKQLLRGFGSICSICVGREFTFGFKRGGDVTLLRRMGDELGFFVHGLAAVALDSKTVSSTRIRKAIADGELDSASQMLGRDYKLSGKVTRGDGIGRTLGFPTANIDVQRVQTPPNGVYAVHVFRGGRALRGVANIGVRPTVADSAPPLRLEVHLLNFEGDLYEETLEIQFLSFIRPEKKFRSVDELKIQISRDIETANQRF